MPDRRTERKAQFIRRLAEYLVLDQARKSIDLGMNKPAAVEWAELRSMTPINGYPTVEQAETILTEFLS